MPDDALVEVARFTPPGGMIDFANDDITLQFAQEPANVVFSRFTIPAGTGTAVSSEARRLDGPRGHEPSADPVRHDHRG